MPNSKVKHFAWLKLYLLSMSLVGIIGSLICLGGALYAILSHSIITDEEYLNSDRNYYKFDVCNDDIYSPVEKSYIPKTSEEKNNCLKDQKQKILLSRSVSFKEDLIGFGSRGLLFIILLIAHLPIFLKQTRKH